jgi:hypothetical protein
MKTYTVHYQAFCESCDFQFPYWVRKNSQVQVTQKEVDDYANRQGKSKKVLQKTADWNSAIH